MPGDGPLRTLGRSATAFRLPPPRRPEWSLGGDMLKVLRQGQRWIMGLVVLVVGGVFAAFVGVGGPLFRGNPADAVVVVDGLRFGSRELLRARAQQEDEAKRILGDSFDPRTMTTQLDVMAANSLVQTGILAREAERMGIRVSDDEVAELVRQLPSFRDEQGQFRPEAIKNYIQYEYGTERRFLEAMRRQLLAQKALRLISEGAYVSDAEARDALERQLETVEIAYVTIDAAKPGAGVAVDDGQVDALLGSDPDRVKRFYDEHPDRFNAPEKVRARHVLVRVPPDATAEAADAARERATALRARIEAGEDFAKIAAEASDDPGSKAAGGDLGFFQRGQMVKPFEEAAFVLEPGGLSDVVKTDFGFHVIRVEEKKPAESRSFEDARRDIAREILTADAAKAAARERADALARKVAEGRSLEDVARADALTLERTAPLPRRPDGFIPGLGAAPEVLSAAFALTAEKPSSDRVFEVGDELILIQRLAHRTPSDEDLTKELSTARERMLEEERSALQTGWLQSQREALTQAGKLSVDLDVLTR